ncbi:hypothetical protein FC650_21125 [Vibrio natriegens]|uniref:OmpG porin family protein n=1 Tax=Vibrio natriegens TaxID=691 RepID=UPI001594A5B1|nr:OmpG porin family protein [Vibrio natriegens]NVC96057.1 hypothetical protein [Vibrio natriegens]
MNINYRSLALTVCASSLLLSFPSMAQVTGNIDIANENEFTRFDDQNVDDRGFSKLAISGFFQNADLYPGWFAGFYNMREDGYSGRFGNQHYENGNSVMEVTIGKFNEAFWGNWGAEVMMGHESAPDAYKIRPKVFAWYPVTDRLHFNGYAMYVYQEPRKNAQESDEQVMTELELEPQFTYRINNNFTPFVKLFWRDRHQEITSSANADRIENEYAIKPGVNMFFDKWKISLWGEMGRWEISTSQELLKRYDYWRISGSTDVPISDSFSFNTELGYQENYNPKGPWDNSSPAKVPFVKLGIRYLF